MKFNPKIETLSTKNIILRVDQKDQAAFIVSPDTAALVRALSLMTDTLDDIRQSLSRLSGGQDGIDDITHQLYHMVEELKELKIPKNFVSSREKDDINSDKVLEFDFLRFLLLMQDTKPKFFELAKSNVQPSDLKDSVCKEIYRVFCENISQNNTCDWLLLASQLDDYEGQRAISEILRKKIKRERAEEQFTEIVQRILDRNWMEAREAIKLKVQSGDCSDEESAELVKRFDCLRRTPPKLNLDVWDHYQ